MCALRMKPGAKQYALKHTGWKEKRSVSLG